MQVTITLDAESACFLVLALKRELSAGRQAEEATARVYNEVVEAILAKLPKNAPQCEPIAPLEH